LEAADFAAGCGWVGGLDQGGEAAGVELVEYQRIALGVAEQPLVGGWAVS
jgi:hypothetical protein